MNGDAETSEDQREGKRAAPIDASDHMRFVQHDEPLNSLIRPCAAGCKVRGKMQANYEHHRACQPRGGRQRRRPFSMISTLPPCTISPMRTQRESSKSVDAVKSSSWSSPSFKACSSGAMPSEAA